MNTFRIETPFNKLEFIDANNVKWEINSKKNKKRIISNVIVATLILGIGIIAYYDNQPNNPALFLGIIFELFAILTVNTMFATKRRYRNKIIEIAEKYANIKMDCVYEFSEESIKYWDKQKHLDLKWEVFTSYSLYKDYLLINLNDSFLNSYIFKKDSSDTEEYDRIYEFAESKLKQKEILMSKNKK